MRKMTLFFVSRPLFSLHFLLCSFNDVSGYLLFLACEISSFYGGLRNIRLFPSLEKGKQENLFIIIERGEEAEGEEEENEGEEEIEEEKNRNRRRKEIE